MLFDGAILTMHAVARKDAIYFVGIAQKGVSIDSVLSHLDQSDDDNVEYKKTKLIRIENCEH
jgi:hypothetical protein